MHKIFLLLNFLSFIGCHLTCEDTNQALSNFEFLGVLTRKDWNYSPRGHHRLLLDNGKTTFCTLLMKIEYRIQLQLETP